MIGDAYGAVAAAQLVAATSPPAGPVRCHLVTSDVAAAPRELPGPDWSGGRVSSMTGYFTALARGVGLDPGEFGRWEIGGE